MEQASIFSGKEDEWSEWSFVTKSNVSLLSTHVPALLTSDTATSQDASMTATAAKKFFHVLVMNVRVPALAMIRGIKRERSIGMASVDHET